MTQSDFLTAYKKLDASQLWDFVQNDIEQNLAAPLAEKEAQIAEIQKIHDDFKAAVNLKKTQTARAVRDPDTDTDSEVLKIWDEKSAEQLARDEVAAAQAKLDAILNPPKVEPIPSTLSFTKQ